MNYGLENELIKLLKVFPNEKWNYSKLSANPNITAEYIIENKNKL